MPRYTGRRIVIIPPSTDRTIVFPYNWWTRKFNSTHYFPGMTNNAAPTEEITQFLEEIQRQLADYHSAAGHKCIRIMAFGIILIFIAFGVAIPVSISSMAKTVSAGESSGFPTVIPIAFGILFGYLFLFIILNAIFAARGRSKLREVKESVTTFILQRSADCKQRGFAWILPTNFPYWVELWRIDSMQSMQPMQAPYTAVPMQQLGLYNNLGVPQNVDVMNTSSDVLYPRTTENSSLTTMMQPMQIQMQSMRPMQVQIQPQQGFYMQNQYGNNYNTYGKFT